MINLTPIKWFYTAQKMKFSIKETADLVTFTEEILNGKLYFLCSVSYVILQFRLSSFENVITILYDFEKQWLGNYTWKAIVCTKKLHLFKGEEWIFKKWEKTWKQRFSFGNWWRARLGEMVKKWVKARFYLSWNYSRTLSFLEKIFIHHAWILVM